MRVVDAVSLRSRRRKLRLFLDAMRPTADTTVLDVGVDEVGFGAPKSRDAARTTSSRSCTRGRSASPRLAHDGAGFRDAYPHVAYVQGDACALPFPTAPSTSCSPTPCSSTSAARSASARSSPRRCAGGRVFLTTPNRWFPIEVHTRLPLVHWLPERTPHIARYDLAGRSWAKENHLLGPSELRALFPAPCGS